MRPRLGIKREAPPLISGFHSSVVYSCSARLPTYSAAATRDPGSSCWIRRLYWYTSGSIRFGAMTFAVSVAAGAVVVMPQGVGGTVWTAGQIFKALDQFA